MRLISLLGGAVWTDFIVLVITKLLPGEHLSFLPPTNSLRLWYDKFGIAAVSADVLSAVIGVLVAMFLFPGAYGLQLILASIFVQFLHDLFFYLVVILGLPKGQNTMIDVFKSYAEEGGWTILLADSMIVTSTVIIAELTDYLLSYRASALSTLLGMYSLIYITYTK